MSDTAVKKPNAVKAAWRRFKDRMKLTWIGWLYICARRTFGGILLLSLLALCLGIGSIHFIFYLSVLPYASWDELPCQTGTLVKINPGHRSPPIAFLVDEAGNEHKFYNFGSRGQEVERRKSFIGQTVKVCYVHRWKPLPPFYSKQAYRTFFSTEMQSETSMATPAAARAFDVKGLEVSLLWFGLPIFLWLLKRHACEAWRARRAYLDALSNPVQSNSESPSP